MAETFQIVATRDFIVRCEVAITEFGHRWRFTDAYAPFSTDVYGSVDEAFQAARSFANVQQVPIKPE